MNGATPASPDPDPTARASFTHADEIDTAERLAMEHEVEFAATERMMFFSDAVVAIAITLLALELPLPEGRTATEILHSAADSFNEYLAFFISFFVIAFHWRSHHRVFRYVNRVTSRVVSMNVWWLFLIVITPFTTKFLSTGDGVNLLRFGTYAALQAIQYLLFIAMILVIMRSDFLKPGTDLDHFRHTVRRITPVALGFALSIPVFELLPLLGIDQGWAFAAWGVLPTAIGLIGRLVRRRGHAPVTR